MVLQNEFSTLESLLNQLGDREIQRVLVEGGPTTVRHFLNAGMVDEFFLVHADCVHEKPLPSEITQAVLEGAGLSKYGELVWGEERVEHYVKSASAES